MIIMLVKASVMECEDKHCQTHAQEGNNEPMLALENILTNNMHNNHYNNVRDSSK